MGIAENIYLTFVAELTEINKLQRSNKYLSCGTLTNLFNSKAFDNFQAGTTLELKGKVTLKPEFLLTCWRFCKHQSINYPPSAFNAIIYFGPIAKPKD